MKKFLVLGLLPILAACVAPSTNINPKTAPAPAEAAATGYDRTAWGNWKNVSGTCDTRETVLKNQGQDVKLDANCKSIAGSWTSPYDGVVITQERLVDIDHVVPLKEAYISGANTWNAAQRSAFYNDLDNLVAVSQKSNRTKGDSDPAVWIPTNKAYLCTYINKYVAVKLKYHLTEDSKESQRIQELHKGC